MTSGNVLYFVTTPEDNGHYHGAMPFRDLPSKSSKRNNVSRHALNAPCDSAHPFSAERSNTTNAVCKRGDVVRFPELRAKQSIVGIVSLLLLVCALVGCQAVGKSSTSNPGVTGSMVVASSSLDFGTVQVGSSKTMTETVTNESSTTVNITGASVSGSGFQLSGITTPVSLAPGQTLTISVVFSPKATGKPTGTVSLTTDLSSASNMTFSVSGNAVSAGQLAVNPANMNFGNVPVGSSLQLSATLTNNGGTSVSISQAAVNGAGFTRGNLSLPVNVAAAQSVVISVTFTPSTSGASSGTLTVTSNSTNPTLTVNLSGSGSSPGQLAVAPPSINFGSVVVGSSQSQSATLSATGSSVTVASVGGTTSEFSVTGINFPVTIPAGQSVSFTEKFTPQASGAASSTLSFGSNATNSPAVQALSGSGTPAPQHSVDLSWNASTSAVVGYNVYRGTQSGGPYSRVNSVLNAGTSFSDGTVLGGQTYFYVVTAVDGSNVESGFSNQVQAAIPFP
jgi:ASPM-SPD-2-Hydin domain-containing protein/centrosomal CEP192-like protein